MGYCYGEFICETERVVLATKDMSLEDVFYCRTYTVLLDTLLRRAPLRELIEYINSINILVSDLTRKLTDNISKSPDDVQACLKEYKDSYLEAMFDTEEEVTKYMEKNGKSGIIPIIMAGGLGKRMQSEIPKVLHLILVTLLEISMALKLVQS